VIVTPIEILMVEDNQGDVVLAGEALRGAKVANRIHVARNGAEAFEFLYRCGRHPDAPRPDLILLDLNLPGTDGRQVLAKIKADPGLQSIPVVVLSGSRAEQDVARAYLLHANCYIVKPVDFAGLLEVVRSINDFWLSVVKLPPNEA
jgi:CheY-like chemotaxis protein